MLHMKILYNKKTKKILKHQGIRALRIMGKKGFTADGNSTYWAILTENK